MPVKGGAFKPQNKPNPFLAKVKKTKAIAKLNGDVPALSAFEPIKIHELKRHGFFWTILASARDYEPVEYSNKSVAWFTTETDPRTGLYREALPRVAAEFNEHLAQHCRKTNQHPRLTRFEVAKLERAEKKKAPKGKEKPKANPFTARASRKGN